MYYGLMTLTCIEELPLEYKASICEGELMLFFKANLALFGLSHSCDERPKLELRLLR